MSASCAMREMLLHANGHHMLVASEPLAEARARILRKGAGEITAIKRIVNVRHSLECSKRSSPRSKACGRSAANLMLWRTPSGPALWTSASSVREFGNALAAGAARPNPLAAIGDDKDFGNLPARRSNHRGNSARLGATAGRISGVLHIGAREDPPPGSGPRRRRRNANKAHRHFRAPHKPRRRACRARPERRLAEWRSSAFPKALSRP